MKAYGESSLQYVGKIDFQYMSESDNPPREKKERERSRSLFEWKIFVLVLVQGCGWLVIIGSHSSASGRSQCAMRRRHQISGGFHHSNREPEINIFVLIFVIYI